MRLSVIVAVAGNGVIGREGGLPWRLSADLRRFKRLTMGHHLIVGRKTWESIGRPLPGRRMIVVSRGAPRLPEGVALAGSLDEALARARRAGDDEAFVGGGAALFAEALPRADRLYLTRVLADVEGDVSLPELEHLDLDAWRLVESAELAADERNDHPTRFELRERHAEDTAS